MSNSFAPLAVAIGLVAGLAAPALAQVIETPTSTAVVVPPGAPGVVAPMSGATGSQGAVNFSPTGRPADTISNESAAAGNSNQPTQVAPQGGGGGR